MFGDTERMARAGEYVLGRMSAGERERAERDLETDDAFRLAVMEVAERMRQADGAGGGADEVEWASLASHLAALPHMQGAALPGGFPASPDGAAERNGPAGSRPRHALRRWAGKLWGALRRRGVPSRGVAVLQTGTRETAAVIEAADDGRLRLLLLQDFPLRAGERLSLWGQQADGAYRRLAGFAPRPEIGLKASGPAASCIGFALARERASPSVPGRMSLPPLAEGLLRPLAGQEQATAGDAGQAEHSSTGRKGAPG